MPNPETERAAARRQCASTTEKSVAGCGRCPVREQAICSALEDDGRERLSRIGRRMRIPPGQRLIWEGDPSTLVANVIEGTMKLSVSTSDGREQIVGVVYASDFIGRPFGSTSSQNVTALTAASVCVFPRADFDRFAKQYPALEHSLLDRTLEDLDRARGWMLLLGRKSAREKIATFLLDMSKRCDEGQDREGADRFTLPLNRQQIAELLGTTIETVSRQLSDLKHQGIISLPSRAEIEIHDRDELKDMAEIA